MLLVVLRSVFCAALLPLALGQRGEKAPIRRNLHRQQEQDNDWISTQPSQEDRLSTKDMVASLDQYLTELRPSVSNLLKSIGVADTLVAPEAASKNGKLTLRAHVTKLAKYISSARATVEIIEKDCGISSARKVADSASIWSKVRSLSSQAADLMDRAAVLRTTAQQLDSLELRVTLLHGVDSNPPTLKNHKKLSERTRTLKAGISSIQAKMAAWESSLLGGRSYTADQFKLQGTSLNEDLQSMQGAVANLSKRMVDLLAIRG